jgi:hypothetical protein
VGENTGFKGMKKRTSRYDYSGINDNEGKTSFKWAVLKNWILQGIKKDPRIRKHPEVRFGRK